MQSFKNLVENSTTFGLGFAGTGPCRGAHIISNSEKIKIKDFYVFFLFLYFFLGIFSSCRFLSSLHILYYFTRNSLLNMFRFYLFHNSQVYIASISLRFQTSLLYNSHLSTRPTSCFFSTFLHTLGLPHVRVCYGSGEPSNSLSF